MDTHTTPSQTADAEEMQQSLDAMRSAVDTAWKAFEREPQALTRKRFEALFLCHFILNKMERNDGRSEREKAEDVVACLKALVEDSNPDGL